MVQILPTNTFTTAKWIVSPTLSNGTHTTIGAALTSASSGDTIFIRPGTYTEDLTLKAGVNLTAYDCDATTPNVTIAGNATFSVDGTVSISGINLKTNSASVLTLSDVGASFVNLINCFITSSNAVPFTITGSTHLNLYNCNGLDSNNGKIFAASGGAVQMVGCYFQGAVGSTASTFTNGASITIRNSTFTMSFNMALTSQFLAYNSDFGTLATNVTFLTTSGTGVLHEIDNCVIQSGNASAISIGAGTVVSVYNCVVTSSNTNAITGAGTLNYGGIVFSGTSSTINTTTQVPIAYSVPQGGTGLTSTTANQLLYSSATNVIGGLTSGNSLLAATNASGTMAMRAFKVVVQKFTATGTYTPTTGMLYCVAECVGSGGGSGGCATTGAGQTSCSGGGGGGGFARGVFSAATIGASQAVTVGAGGLAGTAGTNNGGTGGTVSLGALLSCTGGIGGVGGSTTTQTSQGAAGGTGTGGDFQSTGAPGGGLINDVFLFALSGQGGASIYGGGGPSLAYGGGAAIAGNSFGSGAGGGSNPQSTSQIAGAAGAKGIVIITEYVIN